MKRTTRLRRKKATPRRSERARDVDYMLDVKRLRCCARTMGAWAGLCEGPIEADHAGIRPLGRKADDVTCIPLCTRHHRERTDHAGVFRHWSSGQMRTWLDERIKDTQTAVLRLRQDGEAVPW